MGLADFDEEGWSSLVAFSVQSYQRYARSQGMISQCSRASGRRLEWETDLDKTGHLEHPRCRPRESRRRQSCHLSCQTVLV